MVFPEMGSEDQAHHGGYPFSKNRAFFASPQGLKCAGVEPEMENAGSRGNNTPGPCRSARQSLGGAVKDGNGRVMRDGIPTGPQESQTALGADIISETTPL